MPSPSLNAILGVTAIVALWAVPALADEPVSEAPPESGPDATPPPASPPAEEHPPLGPTPLGQPVIRLTTPDPGPPPERTVHQHDGFYARFMLGPVYGRTRVSTDSATHSKYSVGGAGITLDAMVGGSPSPGFALGGAVSFDGFGYADDGGANLLMLGAFIDGFPNSHGGFHLGGQAGLALANTSRKDGRDELGGVGVGTLIWLGQGFWVADEFSLGGLVRFDGALTTDGSGNKGPDPVSLSGFSYGVSLGLSVLYH